MRIAIDVGPFHLYYPGPGGYTRSDPIPVQRVGSDLNTGRVFGACADNGVTGTRLPGYSATRPFLGTPVHFSSKITFQVKTYADR